MRDNPVNSADLSEAMLTHPGVKFEQRYWDAIDDQQELLTEGHVIPVERA